MESACRGTATSLTTQPPPARRSSVSSPPRGAAVDSHTPPEASRNAFKSGPQNAVTALADESIVAAAPSASATTRSIGPPSTKTAYTRALLGTTAASGFKCLFHASRKAGRTPSPNNPDSSSSDVQRSARGGGASSSPPPPPSAPPPSFCVPATTKRASSIRKFGSAECPSTTATTSESPFSAAERRARRAMAEAISTDVARTSASASASAPGPASRKASLARRAASMARRPDPDPTSRTRREAVSTIVVEHREDPPLRPEVPDDARIVPRIDAGGGGGRGRRGGGRRRLRRRRVPPDDAPVLLVEAGDEDDLPGRGRRRGGGGGGGGGAPAPTVAAAAAVVVDRDHHRLVVAGRREGPRDDGLDVVAVAVGRHLLQLLGRKSSRLWPKAEVEVASVADLATADLKTVVVFAAVVFFMSVVRRHDGIVGRRGGGRHGGYEKTRNTVVGDTDIRGPSDDVYGTFHRVILHTPDILRPDEMNVPEFLLRCASSPADLRDDASGGAEGGEGGLRSDPPPAALSSPSALASTFLSSPAGTKLLSELDERGGDDRAAEEAAFDEADEEAMPSLEDFAHPTGRQVRLLLGRGWKLVMRNPATTMRLVSAVVFGIFIGTLFLSTPDDVAGTQVRAGYVLTLIFLSFLNSCMAPLDELYADRITFYVHRRASFYGTTSYYLSQMICSWPVAVGEAFLLCVLSFFAVGMSGNGGWGFFYFWLQFTLVTMSGTAVSRCLAYSLPTPDMAQSLGPAALLLFILSACYSPQYLDLPSWLRWLAWISPCAYCYESVIVTEAERRTVGNVDR
ncbi:hypothetical protein ACHAWF_016063 [Thalassiosira exigua]